MRLTASRAFAFATMVAAALFLGTFVYGLIAGPGVPIRTVDGQFQDKFGNSYGAAEYERFKRWERLLLGSATATFMAAAVWVWADRRRRRLPPPETDEQVLRRALDRVGTVMPGVVDEVRQRRRTLPDRPKSNASARQG